MEVDEYDQILDDFSDDKQEDDDDEDDKDNDEDNREENDDCSYHSFHVHVVWVLLYGVGLMVASERYLELSADGFIAWGRVWPLLVAAVVVGSAYYLVYMHLLQQELERLEES